MSKFKSEQGQRKKRADLVLYLPLGTFYNGKPGKPEKPEAILSIQDKKYESVVYQKTTNRTRICDDRLTFFENDFVIR